MKYLTLIRTIALLHQHQRPRKTVEHRGRAVEYIEVALADIATANRLAHEVLGRSLDELPPQTRRLLLAVEEMVAGRCQRQKMERSDSRFSPGRAGAHGLGRYAVEGPSAPVGGAGISADPSRRPGPEHGHELMFARLSDGDCPMLVAAPLARGRPAMVPVDDPA